jgi:dolichol-phosphate mannosyltransferase
MKKIVILLPTFNEEENIEILLVDIFYYAGQLREYEINVLVIDSQSQDKTADIVTNLQKTYGSLHLINVKKEGLGKAYMNGYKYALEHFDPFAFIQMDADLSHEPKEIPNFLKALEKGADLVIGSRYIKGGSVPHEWAFYRKVFSTVGNLIVRFGILDLSITDWTSGYRAIRAHIIKKLPASIDQYAGYIFMIATLHNMRMQKAAIKEIPIKFQNRHGGVSKLPARKYIYDVLKYVFLHSPVVRAVKLGEKYEKEE